MTLGCFAGLGGWDCSISWFIMIFVFFIGAVYRKQIASRMEMGYSLIGGTVIGAIAFIILMYITHSFKFAFVLSAIANIVGAYLVAPFMPDGEGAEE